MKSKKITQKAVFEAAKTIVREGREPTLAILRDYLGSGSQSTLHKYLKEWKKTCFEQGLKEQNNTVANYQEIIQENRRLEVQSNKQLEQNKILAHDLLTAERELAKLKELYENQTQEIQLLREQHSVLEKEHGRICSAYEAVCQERETAVQKVLDDKNQLIEKLRQELKETHEENLVQTREWSYQQNEGLMQEKVRILNLQEQVKTLKEELKQMASELEKAKNIVEPLKREASRQKKIIEEHVNFNVLVQKGLDKGDQGGEM